MKLIHFVLIATLMQGAVTQPKGTASLQGIVSKAVTNEPIARASVELRSIDNGPARIFTTVTPDDGTFRFANFL